MGRITILITIFLVLGTAMSGLCAAGDVRPMSELERTAMDLARKGEFDQALKTARQGIVGGTEDTNLYRVLGDLHLMAGQPDEAETAFKKALSLNVRNHDAMTGIGRVLKVRGDLAGAEKQLKASVKLNPYPVLSYYELGLLYQEQGRLEDAIAYYRKGIEKMGYRAGCTKE